MRFFIVVVLAVLLSFVSVLSADQTLRSASDSINDVVILPAMLYMYRKLLTNEQRLLAQQKRIVRLLRWKRTVLVQPCACLPPAQE
jgi:hypothetical protein